MAAKGIPGFAEGDADKDVEPTITVNKVCLYSRMRSIFVICNNRIHNAQSYAKKFEAQKRLEELTKYRRGASDLIDVDDSESSETEDEDGELLTPAIDMQIMNVVEVGEVGVTKILKNDGHSKVMILLIYTLRCITDD